jgi:hypothetical protein
VLVASLISAGCGAGAGTPPAAGIPSQLLSEARPIGQGTRFHPPARGPVVGPCRPRLGPRGGVHVEVFAEDRVVIIAAGIGIRAPWRRSAGRITTAACFGDLATIEPTGVVLVRPGSRLVLRDLFRAWGQPLSSTRVAGFSAPPGRQVSVFVGGRRRLGPPAAVPLRRHAEIVLEVGPPVPPHAAYTFPPGT